MPVINTMSRFGERPPIDIHEILRREIVESDPVARMKSATGEIGISDQYIVLDSFLKLPFSSVATGEFKWNFMIQGSTGADVVGVRDLVDAVVEIQICEFAMPQLPEVPYALADELPDGVERNHIVLVQNNDNAAGVAPLLIPTTQYPPAALLAGETTVTPWFNNPYSQLPCSGRFTIQIREAGLQSFSGMNGARHHFEFTQTLRPLVCGGHPTTAVATPVWDKYTFTDPLNDIHGITIVFRNPDHPIRFEPDCLYEARLNAVDDFIRLTFANHRLRSGDRVFIGGCKSANAKFDAYINRNEGHVVAGDPNLDVVPFGAIITGDHFWTDPAVKTVDLVPQPAMPCVVTVYVAHRRLRIPIRLRRVVNRRTNFISP